MIFDLIESVRFHLTLMCRALMNTLRCLLLLPGSCDPVPLLAVLPDSQLSASTSHSQAYGPQQSRLNTGSAWVAVVLDAMQYIQADLGELKAVVKVATQGRPGSHVQYVTSYKFAYRTDNMTYVNVQNSDGSERVFDANTDQNTVVENVLDPAVVARFVRLNPQNWNVYISVRWEVFGCSGTSLLRELKFLHEKSGSSTLCSCIEERLKGCTNRMTCHTK